LGSELLIFTENKKGNKKGRFMEIKSFHNMTLKITLFMIGFVEHPFAKI